MKQTRIDICYPLGILAKHMSNPGPAHIKALHQLLRYLQGTKDFGLTYVGQSNFEVRVECVMLSVTRTIVCGSTIVRDIRGRMIVRDIPFDYFLDSLSYRTINLNFVKT